MTIDERPTPFVDQNEQWAEWNGNEFQCIRSEDARRLEREHAAAVEALRLAADTFLDFERVMDLLQRHTSADAAKVAETSIRALLAELTEREKAGD